MWVACKKFSRQEGRWAIYPFEINHMSSELGLNDEPGLSQQLQHLTASQLKFLMWPCLIYFRKIPEYITTVEPLLTDTPE